MFNLGLPTLSPSASSSGSVRVVCNAGFHRQLLDGEEKEAVENDYFYQWFSGTHDIDGKLAVIDGDTSQSPRYAGELSDDSEDEMYVRAAIEEVEPEEVSSRASFLILDQMRRYYPIVLHQIDLQKDVTTYVIAKDKH